MAGAGGCQPADWDDVYVQRGDGALSSLLKPPVHSVLSDIRSSWAYRAKKKSTARLAKEMSHGVSTASISRSALPLLQILTVIFVGSSPLKKRKSGGIAKPFNELEDGEQVLNFDVDSPLIEGETFSLRNGRGVTIPFPGHFQLVLDGPYQPEPKQGVSATTAVHEDFHLGGVDVGRKVVLDLCPLNRVEQKEQKGADLSLEIQTGQTDGDQPDEALPVDGDHFGEVAVSMSRRPYPLQTLEPLSNCL